MCVVPPPCQQPNSLCGRRCCATNPAFWPHAWESRTGSQVWLKIEAGGGGRNTRERAHILITKSNSQNPPKWNENTGCWVVGWVCSVCDSIWTSSYTHEICRRAGFRTPHIYDIMDGPGHCPLSFSLGLVDNLAPRQLDMIKITAGAPRST